MNNIHILSAYLFLVFFIPVVTPLLRIIRRLSNLADRNPFPDVPRLTQVQPIISSR
jgi:hypothetical protein